MWRTASVPSPGPGSRAHPACFAEFPQESRHRQVSGGGGAAGSRRWRPGPPGRGGSGEGGERGLCRAGRPGPYDTSSSRLGACPLPPLPPRRPTSSLQLPLSVLSFRLRGSLSAPPGTPSSQAVGAQVASGPLPCPAPWAGWPLPPLGCLTALGSVPSPPCLLTAPRCVFRGFWWPPSPGPCILGVSTSPQCECGHSSGTHRADLTGHSPYSPAALPGPGQDRGWP